MNSLKYNPSTNHRKSEDINYYINEQEEPISTYDHLLSPPLTMVPNNWITNSSSPTCSSIPSPMMNPYHHHHHDLSLWSNIPNHHHQEDDYYTTPTMMIPPSQHYHQQQEFEFNNNNSNNNNNIISINNFHIPDDDYHHQTPSLSPPYTIDSSSLSPDLNNNNNNNNNNSNNNNNNNTNHIISNPSSASVSSEILLSDKMNLQQWTKEDLIDRVLLLEKELLFTQQQLHASSSDNSMNKQDGWQCKWVSCDKVTSTLEQLTEHLYRVHVGRGKANYYCGWTGCARHDKPFTKRHKMHNHLRTHTGERPFVCNAAGCHKRFSRPDSLSTHLKTHSNIRPYICNDCGKSYFHARSLRKHLKASNHVSQV
ncbi:unnamed protein product [Cunninghamella blakesleeana]